MSKCNYRKNLKLYTFSWNLSNYFAI